MKVVAVWIGNTTAPVAISVQPSPCAAIVEGRRGLSVIRPPTRLCEPEQRRESGRVMLARCQTTDEGLAPPRSEADNNLASRHRHYGARQRAAQALQKNPHCRAVRGLAKSAPQPRRKR